MRLPAIELDDRRFQDLVSEARLRINRACPEWTEHNVSDPGITLIELFAWMTEMTIYRLNRVPDKLHVALLDLLGIRLDGLRALQRQGRESEAGADFQEHPGVKYSSSAGAIGVMAVKKSPAGYYLYFAHNTDSFALASMGSNDREPSCVMSRVSNGGNGVAQGARKIHIL